MSNRDFFNYESRQVLLLFSINNLAKREYNLTGTIKDRAEYFVMEKRLKKSRYITGFDGIRTLAVVAVILYHILPGNMKGGFLGVPIFFVLSGYLITDLLLQEWEQSDSISIKDFYSRRIHRLYPGLVTMVLGTTAYITLFQRSLLKGIKTTILANLTYVYNWVEIAHHQSYFNNFGAQSPWTHLWSLSIEGQFYLIWPVVLVLFLRLLHNKKNYLKIGLGVFGVAILSAVLMGTLYHPGNDPSRVYYGTDTRMFSILMGVGLACIWPSTRLKKDLDKSHRVTLDVLGVIALIAVIVMFFMMNGEGTFVYRGGMFLFSIVSMILVGIVAHPGADLNRVLTNKVFTWLGKRSYGIYIYQYPVMVFYEAKVKVGSHPLLNALIEIAIILVISDLSYRLIEVPLRRFNFKKTFTVLKQSLGFKKKQLWNDLGVVAGAMILGIAFYGTFFCKPETNGVFQKDRSELQHQIAANQKKVADRNKHIKYTSEQKPTKASNKDVLVKNGNVTDKGKAFASNLQISGIGDSVMADASATLQGEFPKMIINAQVGRQASAAPAVLKQMDANHQLANTVLVSLGTNGTISQDTLNQIMSILGPQRTVFWLNVHVPTKPWQNDVNNTLNQAQKQYHNLHVIDWYSYSNNHPDWFYADNVHPNEYGLKFYGDFVLKSILKYYNR